MKKTIIRASGDPVNIPKYNQYIKEYDNLRATYLKLKATYRDAITLARKDLLEKYGPDSIDWEGSIEEAVIKYGECVVDYDEKTKSFIIKIYDDYIE